MNSKPIESELDFEPTSGEIVFAWMDVIEKYRKIKKTLPQIHAALSKKPDFSLSFPLFKYHYYQLRKERNSASSTRKNAAEKKIPSTAFALPEPTLEKVDIDVDSSDEPLNEPQTQPQSFEERLAAHQRLAATVFYD